MEGYVPGMIVLALLAVFFGIGWYRGLIRELISMLFVFLVVIGAWFLDPYVTAFVQEHTALESKVRDGCYRLLEQAVEDGSRENPGREEQEDIIQSIPLPSLIKTELIRSNRSEVYDSLGVNTFFDYIANYLADKAVKGVSFAASMILVAIVIWILAAILHIISRLPGINAANRLGGGLLGLAKGVLFLWLIMALCNLFCRTDLGQRALEIIEKDRILTFLYERNALMYVFMHPGEAIRGAAALAERIQGFFRKGA
ncbi:MAG: CvpA family protein [Blautia sp.]|nr:CvpA family protein [Blautia sp.]